MSWIHSCVAIDSARNHLTVVVNGEQLEDQTFPIPEGAASPSNLTGKLLVSKSFLGFWYQYNQKISNLNIFSKRLTVGEMMSRTAGKECGKSDGDYLAWDTSEWVLHGKAIIGEVSQQELCKKESKLQIFTSPIKSSNQCENLCAKMQNGTMGRIRTSEESQELFDRVDELMNPNGNSSEAGLVSQAVWTSLLKDEDDSWIDLYSQDTVKEITWAKGNPTSEACAIYVTFWKGLATYPCSVDPKKAFIYCPCSFTLRPLVTLRGLCSDSHLDLTYSPRNDLTTGFIYFYGSHKTIAKMDGKKWKMLSAYYNTSATCDAEPDSFMLGKHSWTISSDSEECYSGKVYTTDLKLTGCSDGEFTCNDGQCIKMEERCNQLPDCRDKSDEVGCQLILLESNYNMYIPPLGRSQSGGVIPVNVSISISLMKVVEIEEVDHSIHLQFQISLQWKDNRITAAGTKPALSFLGDFHFGVRFSQC